MSTHYTMIIYCKIDFTVSMEIEARFIEYDPKLKVWNVCFVFLHNK